MNCRDDGAGVGNCVAKFCVQSFPCSDLPVSSCKPSSECGHTAPVVVVYDNRHNDQQQSDEPKLSDNGQLEFPKWSCDLAGLKTVWVDEVPVDDWCVARCVDVVQKVIAWIEDFCRGSKLVKKRTSRLIWIACKTNMERQVVRLYCWQKMSIWKWINCLDRTPPPQSTGTTKLQRRVGTRKHPQKKNQN